MYLLIGNSRVESLTKENFENMASVVDLVLANNSIEEIPHDAFHHLTNLETIDLSHNRLKHLHRDLFVNNPKLESVYVNDNQIEILEADLFRNNEMLTIADFDRNSLIAVKTTFNTSRPYDLLSFRDNYCIDTSFPEVELNELFEEIFLKCYGQLYIDPRR